MGTGFNFAFSRLCFFVSKNSSYAVSRLLRTSLTWHSTIRCRFHVPNAMGKGRQVHLCKNIDCMFFCAIVSAMKVKLQFPRHDLALHRRQLKVLVLISCHCSMLKEKKDFTTAESKNSNVSWKGFYKDLLSSFMTQSTLRLSRSLSRHSPLAKPRAREKKFENSINKTTYARDTIKHQNNNVRDGDSFHSQSSIFFASSSNATLSHNSKKREISFLAWVKNNFLLLCSRQRIFSLFGKRLPKKRNCIILVRQPSRKKWLFTKWKKRQTRNKRERLRLIFHCESTSYRTTVDD